ncbi:uncharacterized protein Bfra_009895 [Botrytis fragariae]|uniref:Uncharacterized protein n=1 Tax=Botrytis fragariae TaxID=1964551 RepID=A0A8H6AN36_9HELO|nr:uncharacterized protein Bfra_009895 [Botrytis fragariae]KAF5870507.1 hypothetical protein Bfra_009895 [Botrytis fragariae]
MAIPGAEVIPARSLCCMKSDLSGFTKSRRTQRFFEIRATSGYTEIRAYEVSWHIIPGPSFGEFDYARIFTARIDSAILILGHKNPYSIHAMPLEDVQVLGSIGNMHVVDGTR